MPFPAPELFSDRSPGCKGTQNFSKSENFLLYGPCSLLPIEEPGSSQEMARVRNGLNLSYAGGPVISGTTQSQPCAAVVL
jgi:hypothetical protein